MSAGRWSNPQEWLSDKIGQLADKDEMNEIVTIAHSLMNMLDADQIQDGFQQEMTDDGYFTPTDLVQCSDCGDMVHKSKLTDPEHHAVFDREEQVCLDCHRMWIDGDVLDCRECNNGKKV